MKVFFGKKEQFKKIIENMQPDITEKELDREYILFCNRLERIKAKNNIGVEVIISDKEIYYDLDDYSFKNKLDDEKSANKITNIALSNNGHIELIQQDKELLTSGIYSISKEMISSLVNNNEYKERLIKLFNMLRIVGIDKLYYINNSPNCSDEFFVSIKDIKIQNALNIVEDKNISINNFQENNINDVLQVHNLLQTKIFTITNLKNIKKNILDAIYSKTNSDNDDALITKLLELYKSNYNFTIEKVTNEFLNSILFNQVPNEEFSKALNYLYKKYNFLCKDFNKFIDIFLEDDINKINFLIQSSEPYVQLVYSSLKQHNNYFYCFQNKNDLVHSFSQTLSNNLIYCLSEQKSVKSDFLQRNNIGLIKLNNASSIFSVRQYNLKEICDLTKQNNNFMKNINNNSYIITNNDTQLDYAFYSFNNKKIYLTNKKQDPINIDNKYLYDNYNSIKLFLNKNNRDFFNKINTIEKTAEEHQKQIDYITTNKEKIINNIYEIADKEHKNKLQLTAFYNQHKNKHLNFSEDKKQINDIFIDSFFFNKNILHFDKYKYYNDKKLYSIAYGGSGLARQSAFPIKISLQTASAKKNFVKLVDCAYAILVANFPNYKNYTNAALDIDKMCEITRNKILNKNCGGVVLQIEEVSSYKKDTDNFNKQSVEYFSIYDNNTGQLIEQLQIPANFIYKAMIEQNVVDYNKKLRLQLIENKHIIHLSKKAYITSNKYIETLQLDDKIKENIAKTSNEFIQKIISQNYLIENETIKIKQDELNKNKYYFLATFIDDTEIRKEISEIKIKESFQLFISELKNLFGENIRSNIKQKVIKYHNATRNINFINNFEISKDEKQQLLQNIQEYYDNQLTTDELLQKIDILKNDKNKQELKNFIKDREAVLNILYESVFLSFAFQNTNITDENSILKHFFNTCVLRNKLLYINNLYIHQVQAVFANVIETNDIALNYMARFGKTLSMLAMATFTDKNNSEIYVQSKNYNDIITQMWRNLPEYFNQLKLVNRDIKVEDFNLNNTIATPNENFIFYPKKHQINQETYISVLSSITKTILKTNIDDIDNKFIDDNSLWCSKENFRTLKDLVGSDEIAYKTCVANLLSLDICKYDYKHKELFFDNLKDFYEKKQNNIFSEKNNNIILKSNSDFLNTIDFSAVEEKQITLDKKVKLNFSFLGDIKNTIDEIKIDISKNNDLYKYSSEGIVIINDINEKDKDKQLSKVDVELQKLFADEKINYSDYFVLMKNLINQDSQQYLKEVNDYYALNNSTNKKIKGQCFYVSFDKLEVDNENIRQELIKLNREYLRKFIKVLYKNQMQNSLLVKIFKVNMKDNDSVLHFSTNGVIETEKENYNFFADIIDINNKKIENIKLKELELKHIKNLSKTNIYIENSDNMLIQNINNYLVDNSFMKKINNAEDDKLIIIDEAHKNTKNNKSKNSIARNTIIYSDKNKYIESSATPNFSYPYELSFKITKGNFFSELVNAATNITNFSKILTEIIIDQQRSGHNLLNSNNIVPLTDTLNSKVNDSFLSIYYTQGKGNLVYSEFCRYLNDFLIKYARDFETPKAVIDFADVHSYYHFIDTDKSMLVFQPSSLIYSANFLINNKNIKRIANAEQFTYNAYCQNSAEFDGLEYENTKIFSVLKSYKQKYEVEAHCKLLTQVYKLCKNSIDNSWIKDIDDNVIQKKISYVIENNLKYFNINNPEIFLKQDKENIYDFDIDDMFSDLLFDGQKKHQELIKIFQACRNHNYIDEFIEEYKIKNSKDFIKALDKFETLSAFIDEIKRINHDMIVQNIIYDKNVYFSEGDLQYKLVDMENNFKLLCNISCSKSYIHFSDGYERNYFIPDESGYYLKRKSRFGFDKKTLEVTHFLDNAKIVTNITIKLKDKFLKMNFPKLSEYMSNFDFEDVVNLRNKNQFFGAYQTLFNKELKSKIKKSLESNYHFPIFCDRTLSKMFVQLITLELSLQVRELKEHKINLLFIGADKIFNKIDLKKIEKEQNIEVVIQNDKKQIQNTLDKLKKEGNDPNAIVANRIVCAEGIQFHNFDLNEDNKIIFADADGCLNDFNTTIQAISRIDSKETRIRHKEYLSQNNNKNKLFSFNVDFYSLEHSNEKIGSIPNFSLLIKENTNNNMIVDDEYIYNELSAVCINNNKNIYKIPYYLKKFECNYSELPLINQDFIEEQLETIIKKCHTNAKADCTLGKVDIDYEMFELRKEGKIKCIL